MTATDLPACVARPISISATYRQLSQMGFDGPEAANLTAVRTGVGITPQPWAVRELTHLLFLRQLRRAGRQWVDADDRADGGDGTPVPAVGCRAPAEPSGGAVALLTLLRSMAGPTATVDLLRPSVPPPLDSAGDADREDW
jgi:hypothetical protein